MEDLRGKVAVVTGGASGIGLAMVQRFAQEGMTVVAADVRADAVDDATAKLRADGLEAIHAAVVDVTDYDSVAELARRTHTEHGAVHVLCNNAGVGSGAEGFIWEHELADWHWGFDVNVWGVIHGIKAFVPHMVARGEPGHVVNTSSGNGGVVPFGDTAVYATTKAAVVTITESLYAHLLRAESARACVRALPRSELAAHEPVGRVALAARRVREDRAPPDAVPVARPARADHGRARCRARVDAARRGRRRPSSRGIRAEQFWMLPPSDTTDASIRARAASMLERANPTYFREWKEPAK